MMSGSCAAESAFTRVRGLDAALLDVKRGETKVHSRLWLNERYR